MFLMSFSSVNILTKLLTEPWTGKVSIYGIALEHLDGLKALYNWLSIINNQNNIFNTLPSPETLFNYINAKFNKALQRGLLMNNN